MFANAAPAPHAGTMDGSNAGASIVDEAEFNEISDVVSPPHLVGAVSTASPQASTPSQPTASPSLLGNAIGSPAAPSREISEPLQSAKSITDNPSLVTPKVPQFPLPSRSPVLVHPSVLDSCEVAILDQAAVVLEPILDVPSQISQTIAPHQLVISPTTTQTPPLTSVPLALGLPQAIAPRQVSSVAHDLTTASDSQLPQAGQTIGAGPPPLTGPAEAVSSTYKARVPSGSVSQSRRNSMEGAPDVILTLGGSGYELSGQPDISVAPPTVTPPTSAHTTTPATSLDDLVIPSSQQSLEEVLTIPPGTDIVVSKNSGISRFAPRIVPKFNHDKSDFPSWFHDRKRLDAVQNVEAGGLWEKLVGLWLRQERKLAFGLDDKIVS